MHPRSETGKLAEYVQYANRCNLPKQFIILDNVKKRSDVEDFIASTNENVLCMITSRTFITNPVVQKQFYSDDACIDYLKKETDSRFKDEEYHRIVELTTGFPLRLKVSAKYLQNPFVSVDLYVCEIKSRIESTNFVTKDAEDASDDVDDLYPEISFSIDKVTENDSFVYSYLLLMSELEPDLIIEKYLLKSLQKYQLEQERHEIKQQEKQHEMEANAVSSKPHSKLQ
ncbi:hypothetical protein HK098_007840 [Nowakowskiella sp. JEL0407]|nr:hypothetical protein HK098_007840 [Nowakowskiella sp. JEL0407]